MKFSISKMIFHHVLFIVVHLKEIKKRDHALSVMKHFRRQVTVEELDSVSD